MVAEPKRPECPRVVLAGLTPFELGLGCTAPMALVVLTSYLRAQSDLAATLDTQIADFDSSHSDEEILSQLERERPAVLGWSTYLWNVKRVLRLSAEIKRRLPNVQILLGGPQVSHPDTAEWVLTENPAIDGVVCGEGEIALAVLLRRWFLGRSTPVPPGVALRGEGPARPQGVAPILPTLGRENCPVSTGVLEMTNPSGHFLSVQSYRGCPRDCKYCAWGSQQIRLFPLELVLEELRAAARTRVQGGFLLDADFFLFPERAARILAEIERLALPGFWFFEGDLDHIQGEPLAVLARLPRSQISVGLQSANPGVLRHAGREADLLRFRRRFQTVRQAVPRICLNIGLICGLPGESLESYLDTLEFALSLDPSSITPSSLLLLPGSSYFNDPDRYGILHDGPPNYTVRGTTSMPPVELDEAISLSAFVRSCLHFPRLRSLVVRVLAPDGSWEPGKRPIVEFYQRLLHQMRENGLTERVDHNEPCRDQNLYNRMFGWLCLASHTAALYRSFLAELRLEWQPAWSEMDWVIREFARDVERRFPSDRVLSEVPPWKLPGSGVWTESFLPGTAEDREAILSGASSPR